MAVAKKTASAVKSTKKTTKTAEVKSSELEKEKGEEKQTISEPEIVKEAKTKTKKEAIQEEVKEAPNLPSLRQLLEAGAHFGHAVRRWHPKMKPYIYAERNGVHIFDLFKTRENLNRACVYLESAVKQGKKVLLVGTKGQASELIRTEGSRLGIPYIATRWVGGLFTNWEQIKSRVNLLVEMKKKMEAGDYKKYTKKEQVDLRKKIDRLERMYGGIVGLDSLPDIVFVVDPSKEVTAVREAIARKIEIVAIVDSNCDPTGISYVIPANDDALKSLTLLIGSIVASIERGLKAVKKQA